MRFSNCTFSPPLVSITCSVGTTISSKYCAWFIDWMRCSRLARALFSWPEYVLMTYHLASMEAEDPTDMVRVSVDQPNFATRMTMFQM